MLHRRRPGTSGEEAALKRCVAERANDPVQAERTPHRGADSCRGFITRTSCVSSSSSTVPRRWLRSSGIHGFHRQRRARRRCPRPRCRSASSRSTFAIAIDIAAQAAAALVAVHSRRRTSPARTTRGRAPGRIARQSLRHHRWHGEALRLQRLVPAGPHGGARARLPPGTGCVHGAGAGTGGTSHRPCRRLLARCRALGDRCRRASLLARKHDGHAPRPPRRARPSSPRARARGAVPPALDELLMPPRCDAGSVARDRLRIELERHLRALEPTDRALRERLAAIAAQRP